MGAIENKQSPIFPKQDYIWYAIDNDGKYIYEYDNDLNETMFDYLDKSNIKHFGLLGNELTFSFDRETGIFYILDKPIDLKIFINDEQLSFIGEKDIIQFKMAHTDGVVRKNQLQRYRRMIDGFFMGYKMKIDFNGMDLYLQINIGIPVTGSDRRPFMGIKITSPIETICNIKLNNKDNELKLEANKSNFTNIYF